MCTRLQRCHSSIRQRMPTIAAILVSSLAAADNYEQPPELSAATEFTGIPLEGNRYRINPVVSTDGFLTRTEITSDFGVFEAAGPGMLEVRLSEIAALDKLETLEDSEEFQRGAKESVDEKVAGVKKLIDQPRETAAGISEGVGRFFKRASRATKTGWQNARDILNEPDNGEAAAQSSLPGAALTPESAETENRYAMALRASGSTAADILGFEDSRRRLANRLGINPYSTNLVLNERLDEVTRSIFAGDLSVDVLTSLIPGAMLVTASSTATDWVFETPPGDLRVMVDEGLQSMGIDQESIDLLLRHKHYPLSYQAAIYSTLQSLDGVTGKEIVLPIALSAHTFDQARFVINTLGMLSRYHQSRTPIKVLRGLGTIVAEDESGAVVVAAPVDHVAWTADLERFVSRPEFAGRDVQLSIAGAYTPAAKDALAQRGWQIHEDSPLFEPLHKIR